MDSIVRRPAAALVCWLPLPAAVHNPACSCSFVPSCCRSMDEGRGTFSVQLSADLDRAGQVYYALYRCGDGWCCTVLLLSVAPCRSKVTCAEGNEAGMECSHTMPPVFLTTHLVIPSIHYCQPCTTLFPTSSSLMQELLVHPGRQLLPTLHWPLPSSPCKQELLVHPGRAVSRRRGGGRHPAALHLQVRGPLLLRPGHCRQLQRTSAGRLGGWEGRLRQGWAANSGHRPACCLQRALVSGT